MAAVSLTLESGRETGSGPARRLRREDTIPGVIYGFETSPTPITVDRRQLRAALSTDAGFNVLLDLELEGTQHMAVVKELQRHPIRKNVLHVDFLAIDPAEEVTVSVPVLLVGESQAVEQTIGGALEHTLHQLTVHCAPNSIPNEIEVDVTDLEIGDSIRVQDLVLPAGVTTDADPEDTVVSTTIIAIVEEAPVVAEGEEGEGEGEAGEGEAGEGDADGGGEDAADEG